MNSKELPKSILVELNDHNGASVLTYQYAKDCLSMFDGENDLVAVCMGTAYGGGVERIAKLWKDRGTVYGFDTFEDMHPRHLAEDNSHFEAWCMEHWYKPEIYGIEKLSHEYQTNMLKELDVNNAVFVKGLVGEHSTKDIDKIHYAFLDMDILVSMEAGYEAVKNKVVKGGYLLMHDVVAKDNLPLLHKWFWEDVVKKDWDMWQVEAIYPAEHLAILERK